MSLLKTISGIRGTIGGKYGDNLTPIDIVECVSGFAQWVKLQNPKPKIVVGRDGRISGSMVSQLAINTLIAMGVKIIDLDLSTTPTVEMYVKYDQADAGIIFTASHNPKQWNALKFLDQNGEFISPEIGNQVLELIDARSFEYSTVDHLGSYMKRNDGYEQHLNAILKNKYVDVELIKSRKFNVVVDCINSTGAIAIPLLLDALEVNYTLLHAEVTGDFAHNPEPLPAHLTELSATVVSQKAHLGISIDPDVDRLAFVCEDGSMFGEENTLVAVADYVLSIQKGNTVSNLSSTRALADITHAYGGTYTAAAVGEVNVVNAMKATNAVIGGEGNGGVIVPELHYGRDALAGIAIFLTYVAKKQQTLIQIRNSYPQYEIIKDKIDMTGKSKEEFKNILDHTFSKMRIQFASEKINEIDGFKIDFSEGWVHMRKSNTEPIIRIYAEAKTQNEAQQLIDQVKQCF